MFLQTSGVVPPYAKPSVIFDDAIGGHPDLIDWWTIRASSVTLSGTEVQSVASRKASGGHALARVVAGPDYLTGQINGRPAASFSSAQYDRLEVANVLPSGPFSLSFVFNAPSAAAIKPLAGSPNGTGRFLAYVDQNTGGADRFTMRVGSAGTEAVATTPRPAGDTHAIVTWDPTSHEAAISLNGGAWVTATNSAAIFAQADLALGGYAGVAGTFDGLNADTQLWRVALNRSGNEAALDLVRRYVRAAYGLGA